MAEKTQILEGHLLGGSGTRSLFVDGEEFLNFAGCNYLALGERPELRDAASEAIRQGSPFSRYLPADYGGHIASFVAVEEAAAEYWGTEAAIYLPSGYHLGFASLAALRPLFDVVVLDEQAHWCLTHAAALSELPTYRFAHCDAESLAATLDNFPKGCRPLVATDGAFATTGRIPPLDRYQELVTLCDGQIIVDESHAAGAVGPHGRGVLDHFGLTDRVHVATTLSKAFCGQGAVFTGTRTMIERTIKTPAIRGSNQGSPISAAVCAAALKLAREEPEIRGNLSRNTAYLRSGLQSLGLEVLQTPAPIVAFAIGDFDRMRRIQESLFDARIHVLHSNYIAAGPAGMIRLSVFADHTIADLDRLLETLDEEMSASSTENCT